MVPRSQTLINRQRRIETAAWRESVGKLYKNTAKNSQKGIGSVNKDARKVMAEGVRVVADEVRLRRKAKVGLPAKVSPFLIDHQISPETAAYLSLKLTMDLLSQSTNHYYDQFCRRIGAVIEDHARMQAFQAQSKNLNYATRRVNTRRANSRDARRKNLIKAEKLGGLVWDSWNLRTKQEVGQFMAHCLRIRTGLIEFPVVGAAPKLQKFARLTESAVEWMKDLLHEDTRKSSLTPPAVKEPRKWSGVFDGGYYTDALKFPAIKLNSSRYLRDANAIEQPREYACLNSLQKTKWAVNNRLAALIQYCLEEDIKIGGLPGPEVTPPESPFPQKKKKSEMNEAELQVLKEYSLHARRVRELNASNRSIRLHLIRCMQAARAYEFKGFHYVYYSDFRGRKYPSYSPMSPQGPDFSRALLLFHRGLPIRSKESELLFASHGAGMYGNDKVSLLERHKWVQENEHIIVKAAESPLEWQWWTEADKPFQFLAFCMEWERYTMNKKGFKSQLPIQMDGSNNGLQHFSALMLDPVGAHLTNLMPSEVPQDIYQAVADEVIELVEADAQQGHSVAKGWLEWGVDRKICKRPIMIIPYGGTKTAMRQYVSEMVEDGLAEGKKYPWQATGPRPTGWKEAGYLSDHIDKAIQRTMGCANQVMDWIRDAAREYAHNRLPLTWESPSGFRVLQNYLKVNTRIVKTQLDGNFIATRMPYESDEIQTRRAVQGSSPNFVHSIDASHLTHTVLDCADQKVYDMMVIHDCFGVHAANAGKLMKTLKKQFVQLHQPDLLQNLKDQLESYGPTLPPVPVRGELDLKQVLKSKYLFS